MAKNIHSQPFEESTLAKLNIFRDYLKEWLPVFLAPNKVFWNRINVFDFFAGPGKDAAGVSGSPLIITEEIKAHFDRIKEKNLIVTLYFNELDKQKHDELAQRILTEDFAQGPYNKVVENWDFKQAFDEWYKVMNNKDCANLLFMDQYGVKHITEEIFQKIISLKCTDFLFFISSSSIKRFSDHPSIKQYFNVDKSEIDKIPYHKIHRYVLEYYKSLIPEGKDYYLSSFSLKKGTNVYGLIFGSNHSLGMYKFLNTCWGIDKERGEANFDIDNENLKNNQIDMFTCEVKRANKIEVFEDELEDLFRKKQFKTTKDLYLFGLSHGFLPSHIKPVVTKMINAKVIEKKQYSISSELSKAKAALVEINYL
ncbi:MAG: three-Cys-motif partner protein TcmP [Bacteroidia bacterium]